MRLRSLLFVPGDRPERMEKALRQRRRRADPRPGGCGRAVGQGRRARRRSPNSWRGGARRRAVRADQPARRRAGRRRSRRGRERAARAATCCPRRKERVGRRSDRAAGGARRDRAPILPIATETPRAIFAARQLCRRGRPAGRADLGRGGSARRDRRGDERARTTAATPPPYRDGPRADVVRRACRGRRADRDGVSRVPRPRRAGRLCRARARATASPA